MSFAALILAGTRPGGDPLARSAGVAHKALIELGGRTLLARVIEAVREGGAGRIAVSCEEGPVAQLARALGATIVPPAPGPSGSVMRAFDDIGAPLLVTTADHALLQAGWVSQLVAQTPLTCDLSVMLAQRERIEAALPGTRRTYLRFADGQWSGCNLFYLQSPRARGAIEIWQRIEADRKRPWKLVARLGPATLFGYATGRLTLREGLKRLGRQAGVNAALVSAEDGLAAVDADTPSDLADIRALLERGVGDGEVA